MNPISNVTNMVTRRRMLKAADDLGRTNKVSVEKYEELMAAIGQMFSEDFGIDCNVVITCDKGKLLEKVQQFEKEEQNASSGN